MSRIDGLGKKYELKSGTVVSDEDIEAMALAIEEGILSGTWSGDVITRHPILDVPADATEGVSRLR